MSRGLTLNQLLMVVLPSELARQQDVIKRVSHTVMACVGPLRGHALFTAWLKQTGCTPGLPGYTVDTMADELWDDTTDMWNLYQAAVRGADAAKAAVAAHSEHKAKVIRRIEARPHYAKRVKHIKALLNVRHGDVVAAHRAAAAKAEQLRTQYLFDHDIVQLLSDFGAGDVEAGDFVAYMPGGDFIHKLTRTSWPTVSVNRRLKPVKIGTDASGNDIMVQASEFIAQTAPVEQMTWWPGKPMIIPNSIFDEGTLTPHPGLTVFNLYRGPACETGDAGKAGPWLEHVEKLFLDTHQHIVNYFAFKVQHPDVKINHALLVIGAPGIGKDTMFKPVRYAVGPWNVQEISPTTLLGRFNGFVKCVFLRINEVRDLGEFNAYAFYEHSKGYFADSSAVLRVDEKNLKEHHVLNVFGTMMSSNHLETGIYLRADDRRHHVSLSPIEAGALPPEYFDTLNKWLDAEGNHHVAEYLRTLDLSNFNAKADPEKTEAFKAIVEAQASPSESRLGDVLELMSLINAEDGTTYPRPLVTVD